jgi:hypothetical protein
VTIIKIDKALDAVHVQQQAEQASVHASNVIFYIPTLNFEGRLPVAMKLIEAISTNQQQRMPRRCNVLSRTRPEIPQDLDCNTGDKRSLYYLGQMIRK